jgi:hypothetical protein
MIYENVMFFGVKHLVCTECKIGIELYNLLSGFSFLVGKLEDVNGSLKFK